MSVGLSEAKDDYIIFNGKTYSIIQNPLEYYFDKYPQKKPGIKTYWSDDLQEEFDIKGYVATFEIVSNELLLNDIEIMNKESIFGGSNADRISVKEEFLGENKIFKIDWFTGLLIVPDGKEMCQKLTAGSSRFEKYMVFEIDKGLVIKYVNINNEEFRDLKSKNLERFKETDHYKNIIKTNKKCIEEYKNAIGGKLNVKDLIDEIDKSLFYHFDYYMLKLD